MENLGIRLGVLNEKMIRQSKRVSPLYRPCTFGNPCQVIFRHGAEDVTRTMLRQPKRQ